MDLHSLKRIILFAIVSMIYSSFTFADLPRKFSLFTYSGIATSASLINIIKVAIPDVRSYYMTSLGGSYSFTNSKYLGFELEAQAVKHYDKADLFSVGTLLTLRVLTLPWEKTIPGSFAFGAGLSYSTDFLPVEVVDIGKTSKLLFHIILEYDFRLGKQSAWSLFIRDHHRSGIFGVFDGVVGGSDYLCLGLRYNSPTE